MKMLNVKKMGGAAKQAGFTIIELVVVILLLGILTATALPRFLDISDDAHGAVVNAHLGSLSTGLSLFRAAWFAQGKRTGIVPADDRVDYLGNNTPLLYATLGGFPAGLTPTAIASAVGGNYPTSNADCVGIFANLMQAGGTALTSAVAFGSGTNAVLNSSPPGGEILADGTTAWVLTAGSWAAALIDSAAAAPTAVTNVGCDFYYLGQFQTPGSNPRVIRYLPQAGTLTLLVSADLITSS
jgi:MSHA pilin protein MshB